MKKPVLYGALVLVVLAVVIGFFLSRNSSTPTVEDVEIQHETAEAFDDLDIPAMDDESGMEEETEAQ